MGLCTCTPTVLSPPASPCNGYCIYAPDLLVDTATACEPVVDVDMTATVTVCGDNTVTYTIIPGSLKNIASATISASTLSFIPENNDYATGELKYKIQCGRLSKVGKLIVVYKNECVGVACDEYETCDKCTGDCIPIPPEVSINNDGPSISIS